MKRIGEKVFMDNSIYEKKNFSIINCVATESVKLNV